MKNLTRAIRFFKKKLPKQIVHLNVPLKEYSSFKIGGAGKVLITPRDLEEFFVTIKVCKDCKITPFILGNGTNLLISDCGYSGVIIKLTDFFQDIRVQDNCIVAGAGAGLSKVITVAHSNNLLGMSDGYGIPGTVGGAIYMNASSYDYKTSNVITSVLAYKDGKVSLFSNSDCGFGYRDSVFKNGGVILQAQFALEKSKDTLNHAQIIQAVTNKRLATQPLDKLSAGSVFKKVGEIPAGKIIDDMGLKGFSIGGAKISKKHANFIINNNHATASDVEQLIKHIKNEVRKKHNIELEQEIEIL